MEVKRGMVVLVDFKDNEGSLQNGLRPAVVVQNEIGNKYSTTLIVCPLTSQLKKINMPTHVVIENKGLRKVSMVLCEQIITINKSDVIKYITILDDEDMFKINNAIENSLQLIGNKKYRDKIGEEKVEELKNIDTAINVLKKIGQSFSELTQIRAIKIGDLMRYCNSHRLNIEEYYPNEVRLQF